MSSQELFLQYLTEQSAKVMEANKHKSLTYSDAGALLCGAGCQTPVAAILGVAVLAAQQPAGPAARAERPGPPALSPAAKMINTDKRLTWLHGTPQRPSALQARRAELS